jgi:2-polyprenyl-3-methyl-5-hydroxy-6-metoxy-1,4-benzoquinol methylase
MPSYLSFARFYDGLMQDACYEKRCDYILKLAESFGHDMGITLDLACGTGTLTRLLKKRGVDVFGIDYSMECSARQCKVPPKKGLISCF